MRNSVTLEGRLGRHPDVFMTQKGRQIAKISLATSSTWKEETGEWQTKTSWHEIIIHRNSTIGWVKDVLKQGDLVCVEGRLSYHFWKDGYNQRRRKAQVVVSEHYGKVERPMDQKRSEESTAMSEDEKGSSPPASDHHALRNILFLSQEPLQQQSSPSQTQTGEQTS